VIGTTGQRTTIGAGIGAGESVRRAVTVATLVSRLLLALVFALSAVSKITALGAFRDSVAAYHLLPTPLVTPFAYVLPWLEALVALYLLIGLLLRPTAIVTAVLLVMFTGAIIISLLRGGVAVAHGCGCFSTTGPLGSFPPVQWLAGGSTITAFDVVRDVIFIALCAVIYWGNRYALSVDGLLFKPDMGRGTETDAEWDDEDEDDIVAPMQAHRPPRSSAS